MQFKFDESGLIKHGLIMTVSMVIARFFGYLFQIYVARALGPEEYGVFGSLFAFFMILTIPVGTVQTVISRYTSEYKVEGDYSKIKHLMISAFKKLSKISLIGFVLMAIMSIPFTMFLKMSNPIPIIILGITLFFTFTSPIFRGVLQGLQNFKWLAIINVSQTFFKLLFGILLISLGFGLNGAILAFSFGYLIPLCLTLVPLYFILKINNGNVNFSGIYRYSYLVLIATGILTFVQNIDVILVKHLFTSYEAGIYSAISNIGKAIFFLGAGVSASLFPKVSEFRNNSDASSRLLKKGIFFLSILSIVFIVGCFLFDEMIVNILFGLSYTEGAFLLPYFSIALSFLGLTSVLIFYLIAIKDFKFIYSLLIIPIVQVICIYIFHQSLMDIVLILNVFFIMAFVITSIYIFFNLKSVKK
ncbi:MAG: Polysaccharide biosynthesis protein [Candidatus Methanofastidiosum methylothiophilum]|uniref:Polysaccharide biosynthesis protein n=1 Tax=Candidatus Methanofastidiosum methylothiophilum TaxID=1705564 RepID=A0A150J8E8_9EURY|nr:MAG: Polysaccharide biosynthesis protein [Candidatus Methanofastidiosum methylthiophilus]